MFSKLMATSLMEKVSRFQSFRVSGLSTEAFFEHRSFSEGVGEGGVSEFQSFRVSEFQACPPKPSLNTEALAKVLAKVGFQGFRVFFLKTLNF